jgi:hypothetical protein
MSLLVSFLCRFGWGMCVGLLLTPATVPPGFFRVNLLVVLGLATLASLATAAAVPDLPWWLPATAAVAAWIGGVLWLAMRVRPARVATLVAAVCLAAAAWRVEGIGRGGLAAAALGGGGLVSGLLVGLTVHAMLLGHWYLNAPGMRVDILDRMVRWTLLAWALAAALATAGLPSLFAEAGDPPTIALAGLRWLSGLVGLPILLVMSRRTLEIPNTQSATGILYVACLAAVSGELTAQLLAERAGWPL